MSSPTEVISGGHFIRFNDRETFLQAIVALIEVPALYCVLPEHRLVATNLHVEALRRARIPFHYFSTLIGPLRNELCRLSGHHYQSYLLFESAEGVQRAVELIAGDDELREAVHILCANNVLFVDDDVLPLLNAHKLPFTLSPL